MFDYNQQIQAFQEKKVRLPNDMLEMLIKHREANANRLIRRLPELHSAISISQSNFRPQGSVAIRLTIQTKFVQEEYDVDCGVVTFDWHFQASKYIASIDAHHDYKTERQANLLQVHELRVKKIRF